MPEQHCDFQPCDLSRVHQRLDDVLRVVGDIQRSIGAFSERLEAIDKRVVCHDTVLHGNGKAGLVDRMVTTEARAGHLSIKALVALFGAIGGLAASIGALIAAILK